MPIYSLEQDKTLNMVLGPDQQRCVVLNSTNISINKTVLISKLYHFELSEITQVSLKSSKFRISIEW